MNNLERDSKKYNVFVMETSTQEKTVRDGDWCVPVKHVAKLSRMRGSTSTKTNIKFFVDPEEEDRDNDTTSDCLGSKQFALKDGVSYKCSCCEADGMQWKRTRNLPIMKPNLRFSSLTDADINFFEKGNTDVCELQQNTWALLLKPLVVDSGAGETVMPVDWLTNHPMTDSDFQVARVKKALGSVIQMVQNGNKLVFDQDSNGQDISYIQNKRSNE